MPIKPGTSKKKTEKKAVPAASKPVVTPGQYTEEYASRILSRTIVTLLLEEPFYAHVLQHMTRSVTTAIETAAVTYRNDQLMLLVNPDFFCSLTTDRARVGLLKHEVLHIVLNHLFRPENKEGESRLLLNLACDIVVNQLINPDDLPPGPVTLNTFPNLKLEPNKNTSYYLGKLKQYLEKYAGSMVVLEGVFDESHSNHSGWGKGDTAAETAARIAVLDLVERAKEVARSRGKYPHDVMMVLGREKDEQAIIPWKAVLRRFVQRTGLTSLRYTMKRESRRYGTRPGIRIRQQLSLLVAIDTSGSVSEQDLQEFFGEIKGMTRLLSEVWVVECDAKVHRCYRYRGSEKVEVTGRGGTDLDPVFTFINEHAGKFDAVVYLTDGFAAQPEVVSVKPVLLVINNKDHSLEPSKNLSIIEFESKNKK